MSSRITILLCTRHRNEVWPETNGGNHISNKTSHILSSWNMSTHDEHIMYRKGKLATNKCRYVHTQE